MQKLKIALYQNTNNILYRLAKGLRSLGHECLLIVDNIDMLHRPEGQDKTLSSGYPDWIKETKKANTLDLAFGRSKTKKIKTEVLSCDCLIACGIGPILGQRYNIPTVFYSAGNDLEELANWRSYWQAFVKDRKNPLRYLRNLLTLPVRTYLQRRGIRACLALVYYPNGIMPIGQRVAKQLLEPSQVIWVPLPIDLDSFKKCSADYKVPTLLDTKSQKISLLWPTRHVWGNIPSNIIPEKNKGNEIFLRGLALFLRDNPGCAHLKLVRKGECFDQSLKLIQDLGIKDSVTVMETIPQNQLIEEIKKNDVLVDQFHCGWYGGGAIEYMALGKPLIMYVRQDIAKRVYGEKFPIANARTPEEVAYQIEMLLLPRHRFELGNKAAIFIRKHHDANIVAKKYLSLFQSASLQKKQDSQDSMPV